MGFLDPNPPHLDCSYAHTLIIWWTGDLSDRVSNRKLSAELLKKSPPGAGPEADSSRPN